jgi:riboflavin synthase
MFTGIVEEIGQVERLEAASRPNLLTVAALIVLQGTQPGDSVNVNGACLTVTQHTNRTFTVALMPETLRRSNLSDLRRGDEVNLERALTPRSRLGGHFVQGHLDGVGRVAARQPEMDALRVTIEAPEEIMRFLVPQGYVAVDGASLTVTGTTGTTFTVSLVAYTQGHITLPGKRVGDKVNLEVDILSKYVEHLLLRRERQPSQTRELTLEYLSEHGFLR